MRHPVDKRSGFETEYAPDGREATVGKLRAMGALALVTVLAACGGGGGTGDAVGGTDVRETTLPDVALEEQSETDLVVAPPFDHCTPDAPPDAACFAAKRAPGSDAIALATAIAARQMAASPADTLPWNWEEAVLLQAMLELHAVTGDPALVAYARAWMDHHIAKGYVIAKSDTCAPTAVAIRLAALTGEPAYRQVGDEGLTYLVEVAHRTAEGGINHLGTFDALGVTLWVDSLFMFGNVFLRQGELFDDPTALGQMSDQFHIFTDLLQDPNGWYRHAYQWKSPQDPDVYWGRGNGWVTAAGADLVRVLSNRGERDTKVEDALKKQVSVILSTQDADSGLWWTVVNRPGETYLETSAAALFAFGMARGWRYGVLGDEVLPVIAKAMKGVRARVVTNAEGQPVVTGVSGPTTAGTFANYAAIGQSDDLPFGVGAVIYALVETSGLPD